MAAGGGQQPPPTRAPARLGAGPVGAAEVVVALVAGHQHVGPAKRELRDPRALRPVDDHLQIAERQRVEPCSVARRRYGRERRGLLAAPAAATARAREQQRQGRPRAPVSTPSHRSPLPHFARAGTPDMKPTVCPRPARRGEGQGEGPPLSSPRAARSGTTTCAARGSGGRRARARAGRRARWTSRGRRAARDRRRTGCTASRAPSPRRPTPPRHRLVAPATRPASRPRAAPSVAPPCGARALARVVFRRGRGGRATISYRTVALTRRRHRARSPSPRESGGGGQG